VGRCYSLETNDYMSLILFPHSTRWDADMIVGVGAVILDHAVKAEY
jgi:hypothetical protein